MIQRFGIGEVLTTGFKVWWRNLLPFLFITAIVYAPVIIWAISFGSGTMSQRDFQVFIFVLAGLQSVLALIASGALTYGVIMDLQGQPATIGRALVVGLSRFFPILATGIMSGLCVLVGFLGVLVGAVVVFCMLYVAIPVAVIERPGVIASLSRSRFLTYKHRLEILGIIMLVGMMVGIPQSILNQVILRHLGSILPFILISVGLQLIASSLSAVMCSVSYYYLRMEKEGTGASELAKVFE